MTTRTPESTAANKDQQQPSQTEASASEAKADTKVASGTSTIQTCASRSRASLLWTAAGVAPIIGAIALGITTPAGIGLLVAGAATGLMSGYNNICSIYNAFVVESGTSKVQGAENTASRTRKALIWSAASEGLGALGTRLFFNPSGGHLSRCGRRCMRIDRNLSGNMRHI
jgi:hypothetical protein